MAHLLFLGDGLEDHGPTLVAGGEWWSGADVVPIPGLAIGELVLHREGPHIKAHLTRNVL